jgi:hypothetical protein
MKAGFNFPPLKMTYASLIIPANKNYFRLYYFSGSESSILPVVCYVNKWLFFVNDSICRVRSKKFAKFAKKTYLLNSVLVWLPYLYFWKHPTNNFQAC